MFLAIVLHTSSGTLVFFVTAESHSDWQSLHLQQPGDPTCKKHPIGKSLCQPFLGISGITSANFTLLSKIITSCRSICWGTRGCVLHSCWLNPYEPLEKSMKIKSHSLIHLSFSPPFSILEILGDPFKLYLTTWPGPTCSRAKPASPLAETLRRVPCGLDAWTLRGSLGISAPDTEEQKRLGDKTGSWKMLKPFMRWPTVWWWYFSPTHLLRI